MEEQEPKRVKFSIKKAIDEIRAVLAGNTPIKLARINYREVVGSGFIGFGIAGVIAGYLIYSKRLPKEKYDSLENLFYAKQRVKLITEAKNKQNEKA
ncbi:chorismate synthase [Acrasis kona]|uniref:Chorismate synthase n=1 Tax=Acrasis kona TaxID=1008807 RepID=A0AAW2ZN94_9EUKA